MSARITTFIFLLSFSATLTGCTAHVDDSIESSASELQAPRTLEQLSLLNLSQLDALYVSSPEPFVTDIKTGDMRGRLLGFATISHNAKAQEVIRTIAASNFNPWLGKTFQPKNEEEGQGYNRVKIGWLWQTAHFDYVSGPSRAGDFNAIQLNYARWDNALVLWSLKDEIRQVAPGLWLGQAYVEVAGQSTFLFYFGLQRAS